MKYLLKNIQFRIQDGTIDLREHMNHHDNQNGPISLHVYISCGHQKHPFGPYDEQLLENCLIPDPGIELLITESPSNIKPKRLNIYVYIYLCIFPFGHWKHPFGMYYEQLLKNCSIPDPGIELLITKCTRTQYCSNVHKGNYCPYHGTHIRW